MEAPAEAGAHVRFEGGRRLVRRVHDHPRTPLVLLGLLSLGSLGARIAYLSSPGPGKGGGGGLIFDESYYVNAARVILSLHVPAGSPYASATPGTDPNAEHPPLGKLFIAAGMKLFGDNPTGWRIAPVIFGSLAILAMYWLVRAAGGGPWLALGATSLMAVDNLALVHGRIATLDVFVLTFALVGVALYLRGRPVLAGAALALAVCTKVAAANVFFVIIAIELLRVLLRAKPAAPSILEAARQRVRPVLACAVAGLVVYLGLLFVLDRQVHPTAAAGDCAVSAGGFTNPVAHTRYMLCYAGKLTNANGPEGIASWPWQWFINEVPIDYYTLNDNVLSNGQVKATLPVLHFQGVMNPAIIFLCLPALGLAVRSAWRDRDDVSFLILGWFAGTFIPFLVIGAPLPFGLGHRISYLYYMLLVLPAVYVAVARLLSPKLLPRAVLLGYVAILGYWFVTLYPIRRWSP